MPQLPEKISFNAGELGPLVDARFDLDRYRFGCKVLENFNITPYGPIQFCPGTTWVNDAYGKCYLYGFVYSETTSYLLEFGSGYVQFYYQDGSLVSPADSSTAWTTLTAYTMGAIVSESGSYYFCLSDHTSGTFATDLAYLRWVEIVTLRLLTPYTGDEFTKLSFCPINDVIYIATDEEPLAQLIRQTETVWIYQEVPFSYPPMMEGNFDEALLLACTVTAVGASGNLVASGGHTPFNASHVGSYWEIEHRQSGKSEELNISGTSGTVNSIPIKMSGAWSVTTTDRWYGTLKLQRSYDGGSTWLDVQEWVSEANRNVVATGTEIQKTLLRLTYTATGNPYGPGVWSGTAPADFVAAKAYIESDELYQGGFVQVTHFSSPTQVTVTVKKELESTSATDAWAEGAWSDYRGHPRTCVKENSRLMCGGNATDPKRFWESGLDDFENFEWGTDADSPFYFNALGTRNPLQWLLEIRGEILAGSTGEISAITAGVDVALNAENPIKAKKANQYGSARLPAVNVNDVAIFVQSGGRKVREYVYSFEKDGYTSADLTRLAHHITQGGIVDLAFSENPETYLYFVRADGELLRLTYERSEGVVGWSRRKTRRSAFSAYDDCYESVAVVPDGLGGDNVFVSVKRRLNDSFVRTIEKFDQGGWYEDETLTDLKTALFLDCAETTDLGTISIAEINLSSTSGTSFYGFGGPNFHLSYADKLWKITTDGAHGLSTGDLVRVILPDAALELGNASLNAINGLVCQAVVISSTKFYLCDKDDTYTITNIQNTGTMPSNDGLDAYSNTELTVAGFGGLPRSGIIQGVVGMTEVNDLKFNFINGASGGIFLDGIDSSGYTSYSSGGTIYVRPSIDVDYDDHSGIVLAGFGLIEVVSNSFPCSGLKGENDLSALVDGIPYDDLSADDITGIVTLPDGVYGNWAHVGLPYTGRMKTQKIDIRLPMGSGRGRIQMVHQLVLTLWRSYGGKAGVSFDDLEDIHPRLMEDLLDGQQASLEDEHAVEIGGDAESGQSIHIVQDLPLPFTLLALVPKIETTDD